MFDIKPPREELRVFTKKAMGRKYVWAGDLQVAREFCDRHGFSLVLSTLSIRSPRSSATASSS